MADVVVYKNLAHQDNNVSMEYVYQPQSPNPPNLNPLNLQAQEIAQPFNAQMDSDASTVDVFQALATAIPKMTVKIMRFVYREDVLTDAHQSDAKMDTPAWKEDVNPTQDNADITTNALLD